MSNSGAMQQSCRFERGGWRLKKEQTFRESTKTSLTLPEHGGGYSCALHDATRQVEQRGGSPLLHKELRIVAWNSS